MRRSPKTRYTSLLALLFFISLGRTAFAAPCGGENILGDGDDLAHSSDEVAPYEHGLLYRIDRNEIGPSYLFGTFHNPDNRLKRFFDQVAPLISASHVVILELAEVGRQQSSLRLMPHGERDKILKASVRDNAPALLTPEQFTDLTTMIRQRGFDDKIARTFKPPILALILDLPACHPTQGKQLSLDGEIADAARADNVPVVGLESLTEQLAILDGLSPKDKQALLIAAMEQHKRSQDIEETTTQLYLQEAAGALVAWMHSSTPIPGNRASATPEAFLDRLLTRRTLRMRDRSLPYLEKGNVFMAVGFAHLAGENGLAKLLADAGYTLTPIKLRTYDRR